MEKIVILKIGGSVATYKERTDYSVRTKMLHDIFTLIKKVENSIKIILIHGAGGHVHYLAGVHELKTGTHDNPNKLRGALETQAAVTRLHQDIIKIGQECELPLLSSPTHTIITQDDMEITTCDLDIIENALDGNKIPVLYGDMVDDRTLGMSICSGDAIAAHLATILPVETMCFATDVDGVYSKDPHIQKDARLIERISISGMDDKSLSLTESHNKDMTGGLRGKIEECKKMFEHSSTLREIHIFNGFTAQNYVDVLTSKNLKHTVIKK